MGYDSDCDVHKVSTPQHRKIGMRPCSKCLIFLAAVSFRSFKEKELLLKNNNNKRFEHIDNDLFLTWNGL